MADMTTQRKTTSNSVHLESKRVILMVYKPKKFGTFFFGTVPLGHDCGKWVNSVGISPVLYSRTWFWYGIYSVRSHQKSHKDQTNTTKPIFLFVIIGHLSTIVDPGLKVEHWHFQFMKYAWNQRRCMFFEIWLGFLCTDSSPHNWVPSIIGSERCEEKPFRLIYHRYDFCQNFINWSWQGVGRRPWGWNHISWF